MSALATESILAAGYGLFLMACALGLDALARHSHRRSERYRTAGFTYREELDAWECPDGQTLHRAETDLRLRVARYRGRAHVCNACRLKDLCTDSDDGREVTRTIDPWPHSEVGRFHRGIAVAMVGAGTVTIAAGIAMNHHGADLVVLGVALVLSIVVGLHMLAGFRAAPSGFPWTEEHAASGRRGGVGGARKVEPAQRPG
jgi:hypothetical protein